MQSTSITRIRRQAAQMRRTFSEAGGDLATIPVPKSSWCAAAHFDHMIKVAHSILYVLAKPEIVAAPRGINLLGRIVLVLGWMPRGRAQAPERLRGGAVTVEELQARLTELEAMLDRVAGRTDAPTVPILRHPTFGGLTREQALRFIIIHTEHHLKIVRTVIR